MMNPLRKMAKRNDPTEQNEKNLHNSLDYMAKNPSAVVIFHASNMILRADTDASYLTEPESHSRAAGYFFLREYTFAHARSCCGIEGQVGRCGSHGGDCAEVGA